MNKPSMKPQAQLSLETILKQNADEANRLQAEAKAKLDENERIQAQMTAILKSVPPTSGLTIRVPEEEPLSIKLAAKEEVLYAALAIVRSWKRRHKKNWHTQERELAAAVEKLTWDKSDGRS